MPLTMLYFCIFVAEIIKGNTVMKKKCLTDYVVLASNDCLVGATAIS